MQVGSTDIRRTFPEIVTPLSVASIRSPKFQMRKEIGGLEELKRSIVEKGLLHPIIVRPVDNSFYEVVAGNRRLEAFRSLGRSTIPSIINDLNDQEAFEVLITENVQRQTLSPLEEAKAFYAYVGYLDPTTAGIRPGAIQIDNDIEQLAAFNITPNAK